MVDPTTTTQDHPSSESTVALTAGAETSMAIARNDFSTRSAAMSVELVGFEEAGGIFDADSFEYASALRNNVLDLEKDIKTFFKPHKSDAQKVHKNAVAAEKAQLGVVEKAKLQLSRVMEHWHEDETARLRLEHEEATAKAIEGATQVRRSRVDELVQYGLKEDAALESQEPLDVILPEAPSAPQAPAGTAIVETFVAVCESLELVPERFVTRTFNQNAANRWLKETLGKQPIPGCRIETKHRARRSSR